MEENFCIFIFAIPRKAGLLVQILMKLDTLNFSSLDEMSLLFLRHIRLFEKLQMANAPLRAAPWTFCTFRTFLQP